MNNPIMYADPSGHFVITATMIWAAIGIGAAIGAGIGFGAAYIPDVIENVKADGFQWSDLNTFEDNWQHYIGATLGGAVAGVLTDWSVEGILTGVGIGFGALPFAGAIIGATVGGIHYGWQQSVLRRANSFSSYAGEKTHIHHIVEQSQIEKSGFPSKLIRNNNNEVRKVESLHSKVSSYYSSLYKKTGLRCRNYLTTKHYSLGRQYNIGIKVLNNIMKGII